MSVAAFLFGITLANFVLISITASFPHCTSCPCGSSNQNYTQCIEKSLLEDLTCDRWSRCQSCKANTTFCITCPQDHVGPTCTKISDEHIRRKRQDGSNLLSYPRQSGSCPFLEQPDSGSIRCSQTGNSRSCTAQCLPGYHFEGTNDVNETTLWCQGGIWRPQSFFPLCKPGGHCEVKVTGAGFYNCTIDMNGYHCDVTCDGYAQGRFHCNPGKQWQPPLPYCMAPKEERQKATCPDPDIPQGGSRFNMDGSDASYTRTFEEGESVIFSCKGDGFALQGASFITCTPDGTWFAGLPRCVSASPVVRNPPSETPCRHPGVDVNGVIAEHPLLNPQTRGQTFPPGTELRFLCNEGYTLQGTTILVCLGSGEWTSAPPTCRRIPTTTTRRPTTQRICTHTGVDVNGRIEGEPVNPRQRRRTFSVGSTLTFSCNSGFEPEGPTEIRCLAGGVWSSNPPSCRIIPEEDPVDEASDVTQSCSVPREDSNLVIEEYTVWDPQKLEAFGPGQELNFRCREGYELDGSSLIRCLENGEWSNAIPTCSSRGRNPVPADEECPAPEVDPNGLVDEFLLDPRKLTGTFERGTELTFRCKSGYVLQGWSTITCGSNGQWSSPSPRCNIGIEDGCGRSFVTNTDRVTNGNKTLVGEWPWTVAIADEWNGKPQIICGGALLDNRTVLTAAHCLAEAESFTLYFGKHNRSVLKDDKEVKIGRSYRIISHHGFNGETFDNDIAIVKFYPDVSYSERIQPICLPTRDTTDRFVVTGRRGYVTGWGMNEHQLLSDQLMMANLPIQSDEECKEIYDKRDLPLLLNAGKFCAGNKEGVTSACRGDSGSPMVFYDRKTDRHFIEGIVSFGITGECVDPEKFTVFAKVSQFTNWILQNWRS